MSTSTSFGTTLSSYSRAQALEDEALVDVSKVAREAGIRFPVALTAAAWADCVRWSNEDTARTGAPQDEAGRLWDVVWMTRMAIVRGGVGARVRVRLYRVPSEGSSPKALEVELVAVCGPGDTADPVITIMTLGED